MNGKNLLVMILAPLVAAGLLVACGGGGSSADKTKFCQDNAALSKIAGSVSTADEFLQAFKAKQSTIDDLGKTAPSEIKTDAQTLVTAGKAAIAANSVNGLTDPGLQAAARRVDTFCGQDAGGNPVGNTNASSYSS